MNPLAKRLTYRIMAVVLVMMAIITIILHYSVRKYMFEEAQERYQGVMLRNLEEVRRWLSDVYVATKNNAFYIERDIETPEKVTAHLERILLTNPNLASVRVLYVPDYFEAPSLELFASRDADRQVHVGNIEGEHNIYLDREWFRRGIAKDTADWSEPYFDNNHLGEGSRRQLATYFIPIHNSDGQPVALLCSDLSLEFLRKEIMEDILKINKTFEKGHKHHSYSFVIDSDGSYILHPDSSRMHNANFFDEARQTADTADDALMANMMGSVGGSAMLDIDGRPSWICYRTVKHVEWVAATVVPKDVIFHNGRMLNTFILLLILFSLLAIYLICRRMISDTTTPVTAQKAALEHELKIAHNIQMAILPTMPPKIGDDGSVDLYASETPAREVGGDLYDYFLRSGRLFFCIGDVSGKGMPAALMMAVMRAMFRSETRRADSAADIVDTMNRNLSEEYTAGYFVTMFVGILDLATGHLDYCNAGSESPLVIHEDQGNHQVQTLPVVPNLPVGALPDWNYEGQQTQLQPGDTLFLYTDGLSEAKNHSGQQLGRRRVQQLVSEHAGVSARSFVETMENEVHNHASDAQQSDDITLLAIKWNPSLLSFPATMDEIGRLQPYIERVAQQAGMDGSETKRLRLAAEEAVANVINHGQATTITLQTTTSDGELSLTIDDDGQPFDPTKGSDIDLSIPADQRPPGGMGIMLLHKMTDGLSYRRTDGHNVLTLVKKINKE